MLVRSQYQLPKEMTSVAIANQVVPQHLAEQISKFLVQSADLQHSADDDRITYYIEMILLTPNIWREIRQDLRMLEHMAFTSTQADLAKSIRMKIEQL